MNARKLVMCAFQIGKELTPYNNENCFMKTCPPFSGSLSLKNPNECIYEPQVNLDTCDYARPGTSPHVNIPSTSCVGEPSRPDHGHFHSASMDFYEELLSDPGIVFDYPIFSPETAHHQFDDAMLLQIPNIMSNHQSKNLPMNTQDVSNTNVLKRWRRVFIILNAIVTVKSIGASRRCHKKRKISSLVHK